MKAFIKYVSVLLLLVVIVLLSQSVFADKRYNAREGRWEITTEDAQLKYNPYTGESRFVSPDSHIEYNPYEDEWGYADESYDAYGGDNYRDDVD